MLSLLCGGQGTSWGKRRGVTQTGHIPALPLTSSMTLGKLLKGHHSNDNDLIGLLGGLNDTTHTKQSAQCMVIGTQ